MHDAKKEQRTDVQGNYVPKSMHTYTLCIDHSNECNFPANAKYVIGNYPCIMIGSKYLQN
jgi:hypothetical protein